MPSETTRLKLKKIAADNTNWKGDEDGNKDILDANPGTAMVADEAAMVALDTWEGRKCFRADAGQEYRYKDGAWELYELDAFIEVEGFMYVGSYNQAVAYSKFNIVTWDDMSDPAQTTEALIGTYMCTTTVTQVEEQTLGLGGADGGTYKLGMDLGGGSEDSVTLNWNDSAATIETALETLTAVGAGNVTVAADSDFTITFDASVGASGLEFADINLTNATTPGLTLDQAFTDAGSISGVHPDNADHWAMIAPSTVGPTGPAGEAGPEGPPGLPERGIGFYIGGELEVGLKASAISPMELEVQEVRLAVDVAPTGAALIVNILKNGTTMFDPTAKPQIADGATSGTSAAPDVAEIDVGDKITVEVEQVGSTNPGEDLSVTVVCEVVAPE